MCRRLGRRLDAEIVRRTSEMARDPSSPAVWCDGPLGGGTPGARGTLPSTWNVMERHASLARWILSAVNRPSTHGIVQDLKRSPIKVFASRELERWTSREVIKATSVSHVRLTSVIFFTNADRSCGVCSAAQRLARMKDTSSAGSHGKNESAEEDVEAATDVAAL